MLGKLVWDIQQEKDKLWIKLLKDKYNIDNNFLFMEKSYGSPIWNSITKARIVLRGGYEFRIGDGSSSIWYTPWTPFGRLSRLVNFVDIHDVDLCIKDIVHQDEWNVECLYTNIPDYIKDYILTKQVCISNNISDSYIWKTHLDGSYTVKAGYRWLLNSSTNLNLNANDSTWRWIWKDFAPEKIKILFWSACHEALPTSAMLYHRHIAPSPVCQRCQSASEDIFHILRDCPLAKTIVDFYDIAQWLRVGVSSPNGSIFAAAVWWNWRARNIICIAKENLTLYRLKMEVLNLAKDISKFAAYNNATTVTPRWIQWHPSREICTILNVDGSCIGNPGPSGIGGLIRNSNGEWICGFAGFLGHQDNLFAELMAIFKGLTLARETNVFRLICYSDSLNAVNLILNEVNQFHRYATIIQRIKNLMNQNLNVQLSHCLREANAPADFLAKLGANGDSRWELFDQPPQGIDRLLQDDADGVNFMRM